MATILARIAGNTAAAIMSFLREIADESVYKRHLAAHGLTHSGEQWRKFCDSRLSAKHQRPRCC